MKSQRVTIKIAQRAESYDIKIGSGLIASAGVWARRCLGRKTRRLHVVSNPTVFTLYGKQVIESLDASGFGVSHFLMKDGERYKDLASLRDCLSALSQNSIGRTDALVALGGGVVGDLAGFSAAVHLRGVRFLQVPTTLLSMVDSSVGGKTGVNSPAGKNLVGAFHQPAGVLIDVDVLATLPRREMTAGFCEMIKHGTLSGRELLNRTCEFLGRQDRNFRSEISNLIAENVAFKASIVAGDECESPGKSDAKSRKILNLGHTLAHALEKVTDYRTLRHGEAVGYGILFAGELSKSLDLLDEKSVKLLNDVVRRAGSLPVLRGIDIQEVLEAFRFDKKHTSGSLQFVLLKGIGKPIIVSRDQIPLSTIRKALRTVLR